MSQGRLHWIWVFYIIIGAGLVLSFGFVGKFNPKNKEQPPLDQVKLLRPETDCRPLEKPCAALGGDLALVARLYPQDRDFRLVVKTLNLGGVGEAVWLDARGQPLGRAQPLVSDGKKSWSLNLARQQRVKSLRISYHQQAQWLVADLPFQ